MDEPLLTSLCSICYIDPPKYTCPRCLAETCSLTCSKRHKIWSSCNGIRDPTVYKPISEVATPAGIDHDYNFIHSIEHGISRSEKVLIEDLGLVSREELNRARNGESEELWNKRHKRNNEPGEFCIQRETQERNIQILKAPKGMRRSKENTTTWNRKRKTIDWQVEWFHHKPGSERLLHKVWGNRPISDQYDMICEEERRMKMTAEERRDLKKRKAEETKIRAIKRLKADSENNFYSPPTFFQDAQTTTWSLKLEHVLISDCIREDPILDSTSRKYKFYIHRPLTPASFPKVIALVDPKKSLTEILTDRTIVEYPSIYVFDVETSSLPDEFMLEKDYLEITSQKSPDRISKNCIQKTIHEATSTIPNNSPESSSDTSDSSSRSSTDEEDIENDVD
ncbi:Box C/D snoRNA protein 1 [Golovinomyces cichoracearum]|uniref:Box C/D snoRNA protein 1 n=1 Tax=Golovinomyces cichoracearum TaxID=62708 RepID=A0A420J9X7_9PEZI|nr:Box C/D snoRNA protein 1 [Golovinomyces cichoracearum]